MVDTRTNVVLQGLPVLAQPRSTPLGQCLLLAQPTPSTRDRFLALTVRPQGRSRRAATGSRAVNRRTNGIASGWRRVRSSGEYDHPAFALVLKLVDKGRAWVKLSGAYRDTRTGPPTYADVSRVARAYVNASPERMVWGASGRIRPKRPTPSPTTQFCSTSWPTGRLTKRRAVASWSTTRRRCTGSIRRLTRRHA